MKLDIAKTNIKYNNYSGLPFEIQFLKAIKEGHSPGGKLPYETDGDARRLFQGCKFWILVLLRVFRAKRQYFKPPRSRLGFRDEVGRNAELREERQKSNFLFTFVCYVFISLKLIACRICVFLSGLFQGSKFA